MLLQYFRLITVLCLIFNILFSPIIIFLCLNCFSFQFHVDFNEFSNANFRTVRNLGLKNFFSGNQGKFFTMDSLKQKTGTSDLKQELDSLVDEGFVIKITSEELEMSTDMTFYGVLRKRLVPEDLSNEVSALFKDGNEQRGSWFIGLYEVSELKEDLKGLFQFKKSVFHSKYFW